MRRFIMRFIGEAVDRNNPMDFDSFEEVATIIAQRFRDMPLIEILEATPTFSYPGEQRYAMTFIMSVSNGLILECHILHYQDMFKEIRDRTSEIKPNPLRTFGAYK